MKNTPYSLGALLLTLLALSAPTPAIAAADPADPAPVGARHRHTGSEISAFLTSFYGHHGPSARDRDQRVSQQLKEKQAHAPSSDVLLCAQKEPSNEPWEIAVGPVTVAQSAGVGWATVTTHWGAGQPDTFTAYVRLDSRPIKLDDVICAG
ncbi:hypothetical protein [Streptomyces sp. NRRL S-244]|uniref:hypothetical protein n=1 Tax=Streptomyces sp. NRRL S-244 TaxID=1463897 RepID=UPI0004C0670A|nr:hypothetical protein [Streptomyces sp. NRRL S-244]